MADDMGRMGLEAFNLMLKESKIAADITLSLMKIFEEGGIIFDKRTTSNMQELLNQDIEKGNITAIYPANSKEMDAIVEYLKNNGEWCSTASILQENGKSKPVVLVKNKEIAEKAYMYGVKEGIKSKLCENITDYPKHDICLSSKEFLNYTEGENTPGMQDHYSMFHVKSEAEIVDFVHRCSINGVPIYINNYNGSVSEQNAGTIFYATSDKAKMDLIKQDVAIDFTGQGTETIAEQLLFDEQEFNNCSDTLKSLKSLSVQDRKEFVNGAVVDRDGNVAEINKDSITYKPSVSITRDKMQHEIEEIQDDLDEEETVLFNSSREQYINTVDKRMDVMKKPVLLTEQEYKDFLDLGKEGNVLTRAYNKLYNKPKKLAINQRQRDFLIEIERKHGRPIPTQEEANILMGKERERKRLLTEQKLNQSNSGADIAIQDEYNTEQGMTAFKTEEKANYEDSHDISEKAQGSDANILNDASAENSGLYEYINSEEIQDYADLNYEDKEIDMKLSDQEYGANLARGEMAEEYDESRDNAPTIDIDVNDNGIPDIDEDFDIGSIGSDGE